MFVRARSTDVRLFGAMSCCGPSPLSLESAIFRDEKRRLVSPLRWPLIEWLSVSNEVSEVSEEGISWVAEEGEELL